MHTVSGKPLIFLTEPPEEDSRLDFCFSDPNLLNDFNSFDDVRPLNSVITDICYGTSIKCHDDPQDTDIPVLRMNNLVDGIIKYEDLVYAPRQDVENLLLEDSDILINRTNGSKNLVGKCALYKRNIDYSFASYLLRIKIDNNEVLPEFLVLYLQSKMGRNEIDRRSFGAPQCNLSIGHIRNIKIPITSIQGQKTILDSFHRLKKLLALVEEQAQKCKSKRFALDEDLDKVFAKYDASEKPSGTKDWFFGINPLCRLHTHKRNIAIVKYSYGFDRIDPRYFLPCRLREIVAANQQSWGLLSDYAQISRESFVSDGTFEHIAIDQMPDDPWTTFETNREGYEGPTTYFEKGDIGFSRLMPTIMNGKCFMAWGAMTGSPEFIRIRTPKNYQEILLFWLKTRYVREYLLANVRGSSASQKRFTEDDIAACPVPREIFESSKRTTEKCVCLLEQANKNANKAEELRCLAKTLMDKIMNNIFELLEPSFVKEIESTIQEARQ